MINKPPFGKYALCIAHPGHELRLQAIMEKTRPYAILLTDGSVRQQGMTNFFQMHFNKFHKGDKDCFLVMTAANNLIKDEHLLLAVEEGNHALIESMAEKVASHLLRKSITHLIHDGVEGIDMMNDLCGYISNRAVQIVRQKTGRKIIQYSYSVIQPLEAKDQSIDILLTEKQAVDKLRTLMGYSDTVMAELKNHITLSEECLRDIENAKDDREAAMILMKSNSSFFRIESIFPFTEPSPGIHQTYDTIRKIATQGHTVS